MSKQRNVAVQPRADGRWAVQTDGTKRADSLHVRKADAVARGREMAKNKQTELVIKNQDGRIGNRDSYGNDPFPPRDSAKKGQGKAGGFTSRRSAEVIKSSAGTFEAALKRLAKR